MIITDEKLDKEIIKDYISKEKARWHHITECPYYDPNKFYKLTKKDKANTYTAYFDGLILSDIDHEEKGDKWFNAKRAYTCRYFIIDGKKYDMRNPKDIMSIPIPDINFDIKYTDSTMIDSYLAEHPEAEVLRIDDDITVLSPEDVEKIIDRASELSGRTFTSEEHEMLQEWFGCVDENISDEEILEELKFYDQIMNSPKPENESSNNATHDKVIDDEDDDDDDFEDDLGESLMSLAYYTDNPILNIPLTYIAINHAISMRANLDEISKIIVQTIATGNDEFGKYLIDHIRPSFPELDANDLIYKGIEKKERVKKSIDYEWVCENLPEIAPKSLNGYTYSQNSNSKNYHHLVEEAAKLGYTLPVKGPKPGEPVSAEDLKNIDDTKVVADRETFFIPYFDQNPFLTDDGQKKYNKLKKANKEAFEKHRYTKARIALLDTILRGSNWTDKERAETLFNLAKEDILNFYPKWVSFYDTIIKLKPDQEKNIRHDAYESSLIGYFIHKTAAVDLEKAQEYEKLMDLCEACLSVGLTEDGTKGGMKARYEKAKKKLKK